MCIEIAHLRDESKTLNPSARSLSVSKCCPVTERVEVLPGH
jgi:hypothetical protein